LLRDRRAWSRAGRVSLLALLAVAGLVSTTRAWEIGEGPRFRTVFEKRSDYNGNVRVVEDSYTRYLMFNRTLQSGQDVKNPDRSALRYVDAFHLGRAAAPEARSALFIGLGGGMGPRQYHSFYPRMKIEAVEIDPLVAVLARDYFKLPKDDRMKVHVGDGRAFLEKSKDKYDLIFLDAYDAHSAPPLLTTVEFMGVVRNRLTEGGALVANVIASRSGPRSRFGRSEFKTMKAVFSDVAVFPIQSGLNPAEPDTDYENLMMVAKKTGKLPTPDQWRERVGRLRRSEIRDLTRIVRRGPLRDWPTNDVSVLTDDNPPKEDLFGE
jgi:spermidine synthase